MDTLFANVTVVTMDEDLRVLFSAFVGVTEGKISYLSRKAPEEKPKKIVNGEGMVLMPGLINCHTHLAMSPLRGYADDRELSVWLNDHIFPREERMDGRCVKAATLLSIAECLRLGHVRPLRRDRAGRRRIRHQGQSLPRHHPLWGGIRR